MQIKGWNELKLTWSDRLHLVKSFLVPKYIFLFWTFPIILTDRFLKGWQKTLINFLWSNRRARVSFKSLCRAPTDGDMGFPNLRGYYYAEKLVQVMNMLHGNCPEKLINIEKNLFSCIFSPGTLLA